MRAHKTNGTDYCQNRPPGGDVGNVQAVRQVTREYEYWQGSRFSSASLIHHHSPLLFTYSSSPIRFTNIQSSLYTAHYPLASRQHVPAPHHPTPSPPNAPSPTEISPPACVLGLKRHAMGCTLGTYEHSLDYRICCTMYCKISPIILGAVVGSA